MLFHPLTQFTPFMLFHDEKENNPGMLPASFHHQFHHPQPLHLREKKTIE